MLAETRTNVQNDLEKDEAAAYVTYIPSALLLLMVVDNGWEIIKVKPVTQSDRYGLAYLVTLRCHSQGKVQHLIMPQSVLVEKIFEQHGPLMTRPC